MPAARPISNRLRWPAILAVAALAAVPPGAAARGHRHGHELGGYRQRNLVADTPGAAATTDPNLVNAWGLSFGPSTPAWVADNGSGLSTLYSGAGKTVSTVGLVVTIPQGAPTGTVYNGGDAFAIDGSPSRFLFSSEAGVISGWNPAFGTEARTGATTMGAVYKGLAIAGTPQGPRLYATDFHDNRVDVFDGAFAPAGRPGAFTDPHIPTGFAPFGIQAVGTRIVVTYAKQDADAMDDVHGAGLGFADVYDTGGTLVKRLVSRGPLNAPWGIALAPKHFGKASGDLLIGNFGNGRINAFKPRSGRFEGALRKGKHGPRIRIDGLWALEFGNGTIGTPRTLLFTAGPGAEQHGLFGAVTTAKGGGR